MQQKSYLNVNFNRAERGAMPTRLNDSLTLLVTVNFNSVSDEGFLQFAIHI